MSYEDLRQLKDIEVLLETYYNSNQFTTSIRYLMAAYDAAFDCFEQMAVYWARKGYFLLPHNKMRLYDLMYEFGLTNPSIKAEVLAAFLKHDLCTREKPKKWPAFIQREEKVSDFSRNFYQDEVMAETVLRSYKGYTPKQMSRMGHLESYDYDVLGHGLGKSLWLFYDYKKKNIMTGHASVTVIDPSAVSRHEL